MAYGVKIAKGSAYKSTARKRRHIRTRKRISGTAVRPRLVVTRSNRHIVAQVIDDTAGHTLASASTLDASIRGAETLTIEPAFCALPVSAARVVWDSQPVTAIISESVAPPSRSSMAMTSAILLPERGAPEGNFRVMMIGAAVI